MKILNMMDFALRNLDGESMAITGGLAALGAWILAELGALLPVTIVLTVVMLIDYLTGLIKAGMSGTINSTKGATGLIKKFMYIVTVAVACVADYMITYTAQQFGWDFSTQAYFAILVAVWLIVNEAVSIIENLDEIGVPMPGFLGKVFQRVKGKVEVQGNSASADTEAEPCEVDDLSTENLRLALLQMGLHLPDNIGREELLQMIGQAAEKKE
ncbi:MAG: phage holin family protein [Clostridia bacterium]|nr:phage holin family protein [Clostridia bacterium]